MCLWYDKYCTNTCTIIIVIAVSRVNVEVTKRNKQRGAHPKSRYTRTCVQKVNLYEYIIHVVAILVLIVSLSCQIISLIYKVFISLELCSLFSHYFPLTLTPLDYLLKKNDEILIRNANLWLTVKAIQSNSGITWHFVYTATNARVSNLESLIAYKIYCINNHWQSQKVLLDYNLIKFHKIKS